MSDYGGKVKVVNEDRMCFPADPVTLEPLRCSVYDAWAWNEPDAHEIISAADWSRRVAIREGERRKTPNNLKGVGSGIRDGQGNQAA